MGWTNMSPISSLLSILSAVKIIPGLQSKLVDGVAVFVMMTAVTVPGVCIAYIDIDDSFVINLRGIQRFSFVFLDVAGPIQVIFSYPFIAFLTYKFNPIVLDKGLPKPKYFLHFLLVLIVSLVPCGTYLFLFLNYYESWYMVTSVLVFVFLQISTRVLTLLIVGSTMEHLSIRIEYVLKSYSPLNLIRELVADYKSIKAGLSPLLFSIYTTQTLLLITQLYLGTTRWSICIAFVPCACLELSYLAFILEDSFLAYKSIQLQLRLILAFINWHLRYSTNHIHYKHILWTLEQRKYVILNFST